MAGLYLGIHYPREIISWIIMINYSYPSISGGVYHMILKCGENVWIWGNIERNRFGFVNYSNINFPKKFKIPSVSDSSKVAQIICGDYHMIAVVTNNKHNQIYGWGRNDCGQLGLGNFIDQDSPQLLEIKDLVNASNIAISCGDDHTVALIKYSNTFYVWGSNTCGQLGYDGPNQHSPRKNCLGDVCITEIIGGSHSTFILTTSGKCYSCGLNSSGQLGLGDYENKYSLQKIALSDVIQISCGDYHTMALVTNGNIYGWGSNRMGQLGSEDPKKTSPCKLKLLEEIIFIAVSCGSMYTMALTSSHEVYAWGENNQGQLGLGKISNVSESPQKLSLTNVANIICSKNNSFFITRYGRIYTCGHNNRGQLGLGHTNSPVYTPHELVTCIKKYFDDGYEVGFKFGFSLGYTDGFSSDNHTKIIRNRDIQYLWKQASNPKFNDSNIYFLIKQEVKKGFKTGCYAGYELGINNGLLKLDCCDKYRTVGLVNTSFGFWKDNLDDILQRIDLSSDSEL